MEKKWGKWALVLYSNVKNLLTSFWGNLISKKDKARMGVAVAVLEAGMLGFWGFARIMGTFVFEFSNTNIW